MIRLANFLDKSGLSYFWQKVKQYVDDKVSSVGGGSVVYEITLLSSGWSGDNTQVVSVPGIVFDEKKQLIQPAATRESKEAYELYMVSCTDNSEGSLTFTCAAPPEVDLKVLVSVTKLVSV